MEFWGQDGFRDKVNFRNDPVHTPNLNGFALSLIHSSDSLPLLKGLNFDETDAFIVEKPTGRIDTLQYWIRDSLVYQMEMCIRDRDKGLDQCLDNLMDRGEQEVVGTLCNVDLQARR